MKKQQYIPRPIDTSKVELPEELAVLTEQMARNVHDVWAQTRIQQELWTDPQRCPETASLSRPV